MSKLLMVLGLLSMLGVGTGAGPEQETSTASAVCTLRVQGMT